MTSICDQPMQAELLIIVLTGLVVLAILLGLPFFYHSMWKVHQNIKEQRLLRRINKYANLVAMRSRADPPPVVVAPVVSQPISIPEPQVQFVGQPMPEPVRIDRMDQSYRPVYREDRYSQPPSYDRSLMMAAAQMASFYQPCQHLDVPMDRYPRRNAAGPRIQELEPPLPSATRGPETNSLDEYGSQ